MITCHKKFLAARCRQRGYSLADVRACIVAEHGDLVTVDERHPAYPRSKPGLGDMVAAGLSAVGITKQRVQAVAKAVGIKDCGCSNRAAKLNELGHRYLGLPPGTLPPT